MSLLKSKKYKNFDEWKKDMELLQSQPNDDKLIIKISQRLSASSKKLQEEVHDYLASTLLETNPWAVFKEALRHAPNHTLIVYKPDDPFFKV